MAMRAASVLSPDPSQVDQRVFLHGVTWDEYESLLAMRGERGGTRVTYLEGELELMTPSIHHEELKKRLARLLEAFAEERGIELEGYGSWTLKSRPRRVGAEADECYVVGPRSGEPTVPDLAIEVVWTSGGLDKLEVYRALGVPEVWFWEEGALRFFLLEGQRYMAAPRSRLLPGVDPDVLARFMVADSQTQAVRGYREALRSPD